MATGKKSPAPKMKRGSDNGRDQQHTEVAQNSWAGWAWIKNPITLFNGLLVLFTGVLAVSTSFLWWETRKSANAAKQSADATRQSVELVASTAERQLRAYVYVKGVELKERAPNGIWRAELEIVNFGQTPAYDVRVWVRWQTTDDPNFHAFVKRPDNLIEVPTDLGPGVLIRLDAKSGRQFSADEIASFDSGRHSIYVYGDILYWDTFRREHRRTNFRMKFYPPKWFAPTPEGNTSN